MEAVFTFVHEIYNKSDISIGYIETDIDHDTLQGLLNAVPEGKIENINSLILWMRKKDLWLENFTPPVLRSNI